jgi:hypothetical protein
MLPKPSKFIGNESAYVAEFWRVFERLRLVWGFNFRAVELHVDSAVVKAISVTRNCSLRGRILVEKILLQLD